MKRLLVALLLCSGLLGACSPGTNPDVLPRPGDNVLRIEIHAYAITPSGNDLLEIRREFAARIDATNGRGEPLLGDDSKPITNWLVTGVTPKPEIVLSQRRDAGDAQGIGVSLRVEVQPMPDDKQINLVCNFFVNNVEDFRNAQAGVGRGVTCIYRTGFR